MRSYRSVSIWDRREQKYAELIESCYLVYFDLHWSYWTLLCWTAINVNFSAELRRSSVLTVILVWVGIFLQYLALSAAWARVRNRFKDAGDGAPESGFGVLYRLQQSGWQTLVAVFATYILFIPRIVA
ncbi:hypothetical protein FRB94_004464 [Tulasnella sp. JGI-2019a]|nr:hypothetical protein FRB93_005362 [Tulasnella sp. JGI-2019a]KAG9001868.1 hypothetical protein FRB94_004464 [Tulasnella sp. JGI-2019a]KAG9030388.1 hypothetical protein FRB95_003987 [Tulasnella sp. JGI-2019a]